VWTSSLEHWSPLGDLLHFIDTGDVADDDDDDHIHEDELGRQVETIPTLPGTQVTTIEHIEGQ
jgi:hypothetical protein